MIATSEVVDLYITIWGATWRGRIDSPDPDQPTIREAREAARARFAQEKATLRVEEWPSEIFAERYGYEASVLPQSSPYSGPKPAVGHRVVDDPDPRAFVFLTVEWFIRRQADWHQALAEHSWVFQRGDREFRYQAPEGLPNPVPKGRALGSWCKNARYRVLRPGLQRSIETHIPESIVEKVLMEMRTK